MKKFKISFLCFVLLTILQSCVSTKPTYKRYWGGEYLKSELCGVVVVIMKSKDNLLLKDQTGWIEQTYYKPIVKNYNIGDTISFQPCYFVK